MSTSVYLDKHDLPPCMQHLHREGRTQAVLTQTMSIPADAGTWSGGTRAIYEAVELATGRIVSITDTFSAPWDTSRRHREITLKPGFAILQSGTFCGKPGNVYLYVHPDSAMLRLPAPTELGPTLAKVLDVHSSLISSARADELRRAGITAEQAETARLALVAQGYLKPRGGVTTKGKNARVQMRGY